jgi:hypothetical protein
VAAGSAFRSGTLSFESKLDPQPLSRLEEAYLIAATGVTGLPYWDNPYETAGGKPLLGTPCVEGSGRAAGSPDNAQSTVFFMWNDEGTYMLKRPDDPGPQLNVRTMSADDLIAHAERCKVKIKDGRLEFPRDFPAYAGGNKYVSNVAGSTDVHARHRGHAAVHQRPVLRAGTGAWPAPGLPRRLQQLAALRLRAVGEVEVPQQGDPHPSRLLCERAHGLRSHAASQNLALVAQSMGLGGWIHAAFENTILLGGYPNIGPGLGFRFERPKKRLIPRPYPASTPNPVGLDGVLQSYAPPYYKDTDAAIDAILAEKYGPSGLYSKAGTAAPSMKPSSKRRSSASPRTSSRRSSKSCVPSAGTSGKPTGGFRHIATPSIQAGIWMQCHHIDPAFYDRFFREAYSPTQAAHAAAWHG